MYRSLRTTVCDIKTLYVDNATLKGTNMFRV